MQFLKSAFGKALSALGLLALGVIGVALLGAGLIVGLAFLGILAATYVLSKLFLRGKVQVRSFRVASCHSCGRITDARICECGARISWL
ncbi:MAG: hypothetical protein HY366_01235 [Candidatus Aenigmarchaeota archaeon]|nr:hypothetical protein [Candidatus Aenigmarchaeota archaeon]